jgi:hypothetical protein
MKSEVLMISQRYLQNNKISPSLLAYSKKIQRTSRRKMMKMTMMR